MRARRLFALLLIVSFAASMSGICAGHEGHNDDGDDGHHCIASCHGGCCSAILQNQPFTVTLHPVSGVIDHRAASVKTALKNGIKHPPKARS